MKALILLSACLAVFSAVVGEEYVRPLPRKTLDSPWNPLPSSSPQQVHVSLAGEKHMRISWVTDDKSAPSRVNYGKSPGRYESKAEGESTSYSYFLYKSGKIHHVVIGPLKDNTVYFYKCGGEDPEFQLKTPPAELPVTFAVAGDLGQTEWTKSTLDHMMWLFLCSVHVSLAGEKHMRISWVTDDKSAPSRVNYGKSPGRYESKAEGESTSYSYFLYKSGKIHHVVIGPLKDNTVYFYKCGGEDPEFQLKTPPAELPVTFAVAGDLGQTEWTKSTLDHIYRCDYDVHLLPGDLSYADYMQRWWDTFGNMLQPLASARPWMVTEGNHEQEFIPLVKDGFVSYNARWKMPYKESGSSSNLYYSFEVAGVHVIMLGSYTDFYEYSEQYRWLMRDLSKVNRKKTPWLVASFHVPWYNSNFAHQCEGDAMMATMEPLLYAAGVDIVLAGHVHAYERSKRVYKRKLDPCGPVHITIGDGGNREGLASRYQNPQPEWSAFREASFGHGELEFVNSSHALWSWHRNDDDEPMRSDHALISSLGSSGCLSDKRRALRKVLVGPQSV